MKSIYFNDVYIISSITISGPKEKEGPLGNLIDFSYDEIKAGQTTYEEGEAKMIEQGLSLLIQKARMSPSQIDVIIGGDLTNQIISSNYALSNFPCSFIGVYSACSTSMLSLLLGSSLVSSLQAENAVCYASSNYGASERQFRYPLEYGVKKKESSTTTVSGMGGVIVSKKKSKIKVVCATIGQVYDIDWNNQNDMGSAMAYAAFNTIIEHLKNTKTSPKNYSLILTGDLSSVGSKVLMSMFDEYGIKLENYQDAGNIIYDQDQQIDVFSGGSGCACLPLVTYSYIFSKMINNELKDVLLVGTGCLHSKTSFAQEANIPVIAHAVHIKRVN